MHLTILWFLNPSGNSTMFFLLTSGGVKRCCVDVCWEQREVWRSDPPAMKPQRPFTTSLLHLMSLRSESGASKHPYSWTVPSRCSNHLEETPMVCNFSPSVRARQTSQVPYGLALKRAFSAASTTCSSWSSNVWKMLWRRALPSLCAQLSPPGSSDWKWLGFSEWLCHLPAVWI